MHAASHDSTRLHLSASLKGEINELKKSKAEGFWHCNKLGPKHLYSPSCWAEQLSGSAGLEMFAMQIPPRYVPATEKPLSVAAHGVPSGGILNPATLGQLSSTSKHSLFMQVPGHNTPSTIAVQGSSQVIVFSQPSLYNPLQLSSNA